MMQGKEEASFEALEKRLAQLSRSERRAAAAAVLHDFTLLIRDFELGPAVDDDRWQAVVAANESAHRAAGYLLSDADDTSYLAAILRDAMAAGVVKLEDIDQRGLLGQPTQRE